jgi:hypothetical protein
MVRYSRGFQSHSIPCGLGSRVRPLRGRLSLIKVAKLLPSASSFRFRECSCTGGRELDEFPWGLSGSDDTSMTQMGMRRFWVQLVVKKGRDDTGFGRNDVTEDVGWCLFLDCELISLSVRSSGM